MAAAAHDESVDWEHALVQRAATGDRMAFERLYRDHVGAVYGVCLRLTRDVSTAEDATQEAFIRAWRGLNGFEARSRFGTWLQQIAVRVALTCRRHMARRLEPQAPADLPEEFQEAAEPDWTLETPVEVDEIERAIDDLPQGARDAVVLCAIYGYSHAEVASMLGIAEGTCKAQLHRARSLLRRRLSPEGTGQ
jgi:RNA polymerase sigma-70 factor (ECF subfamily)